MAAIERVLAFANLGRVRDPEDVYRLLRGDPSAPRMALLVEGRPAVPLYFQPLTETGQDAAAILNKDLFGRRADEKHGPHPGVEELLQALVDDPQAARAKYAAWIDGLLRRGALLAVPRYEDGRLFESLDFKTSGVNASCGFGLALLYDRRRPFGKALRRCVNPDCGRWFLSFSRGTGPRPKTCSAKCVERVDSISAAARMRRLRAKQTRAKR